MRVLWAPWRMTYVGGPRSDECFFCAAAKTADPRAGLVLAQHPAIIMLNRFPYASAHVMVAPRTHTAQLEALAPAEFQTLMGEVRRAASAVAETFGAEGINIGINLGAAAGAGVADHLHWHIVPRWVGDTNFMPMLADTRVMPEHLESVYDRLSPRFAPPA